MKYAGLWETLRKEKTAEAAAALLGRCSVTAAVIGLDGRPEARPIALRSAEGGAITFELPRSTRFYAELSRKPLISLSVPDPDGDALLRIGGKICFSDDGEADRRGASVFFLTEASAEVSVGGEELSFPLPDPTGVLRGVTIRKKTELRDRLAKILIRREEEGAAAVSEDPFTLKLYDGALFLFAETAKALWPRMDIQPMERAAVYGTWDEREKFVALAKRLIGNAVVDKPEDFTYWLNPETLAELYRQSGLSE